MRSLAFAALGAAAAVVITRFAKSRHHHVTVDAVTGDASMYLKKGTNAYVHLKGVPNGTCCRLTFSVNSPGDKLSYDGTAPNPICFTVINRGSYKYDITYPCEGGTQNIVPCHVCAMSVGSDEDQ